jgi:hypothetical protein
VRFKEVANAGETLQRIHLPCSRGGGSVLTSFKGDCSGASPFLAGWFAGEGFAHAVLGDALVGIEMISADARVEQTGKHRASSPKKIQIKRGKGSL